MDQVAQIRESIDIVSFLSEFITVKKAGRNFKALCPFHNEKSPSFVISPERQIWHCFGCGKGGDVYTFLMEFEHLEFAEALKELAKRTGIQLVQSKFATVTSSKKDQLYTLNAQAREFYHYLLTKHTAGKKARLYLTKRGISDKTIETFHLGFAPRLGHALADYLIKKKKYDPELLWEAGLAFRKGSQVFDFFRERIMFPLFDHRDNVVGFSGRVFTPDSDQAKYVNTKETLVYHKGEMFFGLNIAKEAIRKNQQVLIMEGEFDVLSSFQEGISNTVAVKGTALTPQQASLLARYAQKVTMCFDGDKAGQEAIRRSVPVLEQKGLVTTVVAIPGNLDPDEILKKDPGAFKKALKTDVSAYDFLLDLAVKTHGTDSAEGKKQIGNDILPFLVSIENEIIKEHYLKKISKVLDTTYESILRQIDRQFKQITPATETATAEKRTREEVLEEYLVSLIVQYENPRVALDTAIKLLTETMTKERAYQKILFHLLTYFETTDSYNGNQFHSFLPEELAPAFNKSALFPLPAFADSTFHLHEVKRVALQLRNTYLRLKIKELGEKVEAKENAHDDAGAEVLRQSLAKFVMLLRKDTN